MTPRRPRVVPLLWAIIAGGMATAAPVAVRAQSLDIKAGYSYATLSNKQPDWNNRSGFAGGLGFDLTSSVLGLEPEVLYVQKGVTFTGAPTSSAPKLDYLEIPVLIKLTAPTPGIQPFGYVGPSVSFRLTCTFADSDCGSTVKSTDWGVLFGAGIKFAGAISIEGRYTWGLQNIHDISAGVANQTRTFLILAGVSL
ncbi:MAG TPA: porin family protein [Gemmatimonadales bacterium]|jgi:hypothetical protein|nr:porin family protein [Gemmatimonadales bacterium]